MAISQHTQNYMAWFKRELTNGIMYDKTTGELVYLLGQAFLLKTNLVSSETLQRFGLQSVWFARYFKRHASLPTLEGGHRTLANSQIRLKVDLLPNVTPTEQWHNQLSTYLLEQLGFAPDQLDEIKIEIGETCCHSPCYGCIAFDLEQALERQGEQPFLMAMKAGCQL
jgi:hypothetical protein